MKLCTLIVEFDAHIRASEIFLFRGAILSILENCGNTDILFHNHTESGFLYNYPRIQYKRIHGNGAIVCIGPGTEVIGNLFNSGLPSTIRIGNREIPLVVKSIISRLTETRIWDDSLFQYHLYGWLPLNKENYEKYKNINSLSDKALFFEKILTGNLLSFAKGLGQYLDSQLVCKINSISEPRIARVKGIMLMCFDVAFISNYSLPDYIGLGKHPSYGFGIVKRYKDGKFKSE